MTLVQPPSTPSSAPSSLPLLPPGADATSTLDPTVGNIVAFRLSERGREMARWVTEQFGHCRDQRRPKEIQWYTNLSMTMGNQWVRRASRDAPEGLRDKLVAPANDGKRRRTTNRLRRFTRWELAKLTSQTPSISAVPATGSDEDVRRSLAAEQVWYSISGTQRLSSTTWLTAAWWEVMTGNGFIKVSWDPSCVDRADPGSRGDVRFEAITPFNLFVPNLTEPDIEGQPYLFLAYAKSVQWVKTYYADALAGVDIQPQVAGNQDLLDPAYLSVTKQQQREKNSVMVYEAWVKPGATDLLPDGGLVIMVDTTIVNVIDTGFPYAHDEYPVTHFGHLFTGGFYRDSPLVDLLHLQKEYNLVRSDIGDAIHKMARPQYAVRKGSVVVSRMTNQTGAVVEVNPGSEFPQLMPTPELPSWLLQEQDRIIQDWTEISGESDASTGQAPPGVSAGTAINYLQEAANKYLTPQFLNIEAGWERIANQTVALFVQYVDLQRKIRVSGADSTFDVELLSGSDLKGGTDLRVEAGSSVTQSKAANEAKVMDMFGIGLIDQNMAFKMLEVNGFQKMQDIIKVAERKAQRENIKMKELTQADIDQATSTALPELLTQLEQQQPGATQDPNVLQMIQQWAPCVIEPADFDVHQTHIVVHNQFRMGQEYESLPPEIQRQFDLHVQEHQRMLQQQQLQQFLQQVPSDGTDGAAPTADMPPGAAATQATDPSGQGGAGSSESQYLQQQAMEAQQQSANQTYGIGG